MRTLVVAILLSSTCFACTPKSASESLPCDGQRSSWPFQPHTMNQIPDAAAEGQAHLQNGTPFGSASDKWKDFLSSMMVKDDQLWRYTAATHGPNDPDQEGYIVLRSCRVISRFITVN